MGNQQLQLHLQSDKARTTETKAKSAFRSIVSTIYILHTIYTLQLVDNMTKVLITFIAMMGLLMLDVGETVQALALPDVNSGAEQFISRMKRQADGVTVDECRVTFDDVRRKRKQYAIFYIKEERSINVETLGNQDASYDDFLHDLQKSGECRYGLYSYKFDQCPGTTSTKVKIVMMLWEPDSCKIWTKMSYDASFDSIKKEFSKESGFSKDFKATEPTEVAAENVEKMLGLSC